MTKRREFTRDTRAEVASCIVSGCEKSEYAHGLCPAHYTRQRRHGNPLGGGSSHGSLLAFAKKAIQYTGSDCLVWTFGTNGAGYGVLTIDGKKMLAHRYVCHEVNGPPSDDSLLSLHSCGNGHLGCITPSHLRWGTVKENSDDARKHGVLLSGEKNPQAKISDADAEVIKSLRGKFRQHEIAAMFGISRSHVGSIQSGFRRRNP